MTRVDPFGLDCVSVGGVTTCATTSGPTFSVPTPDGFPSNVSANSPFYHRYNVTRRIPNDVDEECVRQALQNQPTPGRPRPATRGGTRNDARVAGTNWVTSYLRNDVGSGIPVVVNISDANSQFHPGYVARWVADGVVNTMGEGLNFAQSPLVTGQPIQNLGNEAVWGRQLDRIIEDCRCKR